MPRQPGQRGFGKALIAHPSNIVSQENAMLALDLRKEGLSYDEIAQRLNLNINTLRAQVGKLLNERKQERAEDLLEIELSRLDMLYNEAMKIISDDDAPPLTKLQAIDRCTKIMERRAKMVGLDAPKTTVIHRSDDILNAARKFQEQMGLGDDFIVEITAVLQDEGIK